MISTILFDLLFEAIEELLGAAFSALRAGPSLPAPPLRDRYDAEVRYARWASDRGFLVANHESRGAIAGAEVTVRTGLAGSSPASVEILLRVARDIPAPVLVRPGDDVPRDLRPIFDRLGRDLATIGCTSTTLRLRLAPLVPLATLDAALEELEALVRARPTHSAYRDG